MILGWFRRRRRRKLLRKPFPTAWLEFVEALPFYRTLASDEQAQVRDIVRVLVAEKNWEGCGGLVLNAEIQVVIAAQASLLLLGLEHEYYPRVHSILVYPSTFVVAGRSTGLENGTRSEGQATLGEAWKGGPIVLAWDASRLGGVHAEDGRNVVLHEFAHKLDFRDDIADGTPLLKEGKQYEAWHRIMTAEYEALVAKADKGRPTLLDKYGATQPAEFFAVATECFFEKSKQLRKRHSELYELLSMYYGQDPAERERSL